jgi:hypothetical protein
VFIFTFISTDVTLTMHRPSPSIPTVVGTYRYIVASPTDAERDAYHATHYAVVCLPIHALRRPSPTPRYQRSSAVPTDTSLRAYRYVTLRRLPQRLPTHDTSSPATATNNTHRQHNQQHGGASVWMCPLCCLQEDV